MLERIVPVLHNVFSPQKVVESARLVYGLGFKLFVVTKASGSAAQTGVPEAQKLALKLNRAFIYLSDLDDAIELLGPSTVFTVVPPPYASEELTKDHVLDAVAKGRVLIVFGGSDPGLSRRELEKGLAVYPPGITGDVGSVGLLAVTLYYVSRVILSSRE